MKIKINKKRILAAVLGVVILTTAIMPYIGQKKAEAFSTAFGVCIDNHNYSTAGSWSKNDKYTNKMINMTVIQDTYGANSPEYKEALAKNVETLRQRIGSDEQILKLFWAGVVTWISDGTFKPDNPKDLEGAQYWISYAQQNYRDSVAHGYTHDIPTGYNFVPMSETELGTVLHGENGQAIINRDPFLAALTNPDTFFSTTTWDAFPQALPRLSNVWLNSYDSYQAGEGGRGQWPKDSAGHEVAGSIGFVPTYEQVQAAALDMETNSNYYSIQDMTKNKSSVSNDNEDDEDIDNSEETTNKQKGYYVINCTEDFFNNCGSLNIWDATLNGTGGWVSIGSLTHYNQTTNIMGWDIKPSSTPKSWVFEFNYTGGNKPTGLVMYFALPQNSITSANQLGFDSPVEFVARYTNLYTCDSCGGTHSSGKLDPSRHQRFVSFYSDYSPSECYPCFRLGGDDPVTEQKEANVNFEIFRHKEDWTTNYNVQLEKKDYETGKPLENSIFELYERFDDKDQINRSNDGAVELYEGGNDTWQSKYTSSPVIWDDFRLVSSYTTDTNGHIEDDVTKGYHYEKTFCDGHPAPEFAEVPEPEEDEETGEITNEAEIEQAQEANRTAALLWLSYYKDCINMAENDRPGVHFHWLMDSIDVGTIEEVSTSGGEPGSKPDAGPTEGADLETSYTSSTCQADCEDTYDKFINLKYSYTWIEAKARDGYIRHDLHTDDVPIEVITTNSSEAGAESSFANEYSKDITITDNVNSSNDNEDDDEDIEEEAIVLNDTIDTNLTEAKKSFGLNINKATASDAVEKVLSNIRNVLDSYFIETLDFVSKDEDTEEEKIKTATPSDADYTADTEESENEIIQNNDFVFISEDLDDDEGTSSGSNTKPSRGIVTDIMDSLYEAYVDITDYGISLMASDTQASQEGYLAIYEKAFTDAFTGGPEVEIGPDDNFSHCNNADGEGDSWRVYDHRTPGEIHFNKRDFNLADKQDDEYSAYAQANADGTLEGAVYGLFAATDITHPDGKTGTVFERDNLVSIATTDRNGDASFMGITEAPGSVYNYETGKVETTDWYNNAPNNLFREGAKTTAVQPNVSFTDGAETKWYADDYTEDGTYKGAKTQRLYDANEENNMNSWIGRSLILGEYYIKELSRSEGYELSVNGKTSDITNNGADLNVTTQKGKGSVSINRNLYIQGQESIGLANEPFFEVTSKGTNENGGYDIVLTSLPEGTKIYRHDSTTKTGTYEVIDHYENVGKVDENGNPVYKTATTAGIPILKGDGTNDYIQTEELREYYLSSVPIANIHTFDQAKIDEKLKGTGKDDGTGTGNIIYPDWESMKLEFKTGNGFTYSTRFVKAKLEEALRTSGMSTPKSTYKQNGSTKVTYSQTEYPIYSRGIRKGEVDEFGVSGVTPGAIASRTVYGPQILSIELSKTNSAGNPTTNGDIIYNLIQYYIDHPYWEFGGIDRIEDNGDKYKVYIYASDPLNTDGFVVAGTDFETDSIVYRGMEFLAEGTDFKPYIVYVPYTSSESVDSFGIYKNLVKKTTLTGKVLASATLIPDVEIDTTGNLTEKTMVKYEYYNIGDTIHDKDGNPVQDTVSVPVYVTKEIQELETQWTEVPATYENGKYIIHVDMPGTDVFGQAFDDTDSLTLEFKAVIPEKDHILTDEDIEQLPSSFNYVAGDKMSSGTYEVYVTKSKAFAYLNYEDQKEAGENSYIVNVTLTYPSDEYTYQDGDKTPGMGTRRNPVGVLERPIRQKIKVVKDIQTMPDGDSYLNDTYSEVHKENLSPDGYNRWYNKTIDWLSSLLGGTETDDSASKVSGFQFKAYLKSNLERLYRDENGTIVWLDRNGNALVPEYQDTDGDGNYETFVWKNGNTTIDFPEQSKTEDDSIFSSNVQKIFTKVEHNINSTTTGDISNNVWAEYADPQTGETTNVGELRGDNTSQDGENGEAIKSNGALYSYDDKNTNVKKTDKINNSQNSGYTRLLETRVETVEDGAGKTREVEQYNYEKFFDALAAANTDKWDNDMFASKKNYPGQHWFETFEEKYQKDDADPDGTIANTDGVDADGTAGGDRDTSFKPFQWIREKIFGTTQDAKDDYPATHDNDNLENNINTSVEARSNAEASDAVRQFAITWYLDDEVAKLVTNNGYDEDVAKKGSESYQEEVYDQALYQALIKTYNYLKPFYEYDLDTIYSVVWDSDKNGGSDGDVTTVSANTLYKEQNADDGYYYGVSSYLPYGTYVLVEQQPVSFKNKNYKTDKPKEVSLPSVYEENGNVDSPEVMNAYYKYSVNDTPEDLLKKYKIRFNEEWADNHTDDLRNYVIRAHNFDGDYEIYKYGLDVDKLKSTIAYNGSSYNYDGFSITQEINDPLKDYYNNPLVDSVHDGGNANSHYFADDKNKGVVTANGSTYAEDAIEKRYHYGSISEHSGEASDVLYQHGPDKDDNNPSGFYFKDNVKTMTGNQTAYDKKYASMLVPWSVVEPAASDDYDADNFTGYADSKFRNTFYATKIRIEKLDSETGENLLHDDAIFSIYAASRYTTENEIKAAGAAEGTKVGDVKFYMQDTVITGSKEFLEAMCASNITPIAKGGKTNTYSGTVTAGTPVCLEEEQIVMEDAIGNKTGTFKVYATLNDIEMLNEEDTEKSYRDQNVGYIVTPQPLGSGVYVIVETKAPAGYAKTKPVAIEIYSDSVSYYMNGSMVNKVDATIYEGNLMDK